MKLNLASMIQVDHDVDEEFSKYETANKSFILVFLLDNVRPNVLTLAPRPNDDDMHFGSWLDANVPTNAKGDNLKTYSQEDIYDSDDCFIAVHGKPNKGEDANGPTLSAFLIVPRDACPDETELYTAKQQYVANVFGLDRCVAFSSLTEAIGSAQ
ncbi:hypothetical protein GGI21_002197 [Coemansia aciculifera]|nr:hypothetical protein GGI21_002197 [Coemansia aciculifera]